MDFVESISLERAQCLEPFELPAGSETSKRDLSSCNLLLTVFLTHGCAEQPVSTPDWHGMSALHQQGGASDEKKKKSV